MQRLGRILRKNDEGQGAIVLEILHQSAKPQYTFWEALGEEMFDYQKTYPGGQGIAYRDDMTFVDTPKVLPKSLMDELKKVQHKTIRELVIDPSQPELLPSGYVSIDAFAKMYDVSPTTVRTIVQQHSLAGEEYDIFLSGGKPGLALSPVQQQAIAQEIEKRGLLLDKAPEGVISLLALANRLRVSRLTLDKVVGELEETGEVFQRYKFFAVTAVGVSPEQQLAIASRPEFRIPKAPEDYKSVNALCRELKTKSRFIFAAINAMEAEGEVFDLCMFNNKIAIGLSPEQQQKISVRREISSRMLPENYRTINAFVSENEFSESYVRTTIERLIKEGESFKSYIFRGKSRIILSSEQQRVIRARYYEKPAAEDGYVSLNSLTKKHHISLETVHKIVENLEASGQEIRSHRINGKVVRALSAEQYKLFLEAPDMRIEFPPKGTLSVTAFAKQLGVPYARFSNFIQQLQKNGENFASYRFGTAVTTIGISPAQQRYIKNLPQFYIAEAPADYQTLKDFARLNGLQVYHVQTSVNRLKKAGEKFKMYRFGKKKVVGISPEQAKKILDLPQIVLPRPPEDVLTTFSFAKQLGVAPQTIASRINQLKSQGEEFSDYSFNTGATMGITPAQQQKIREMLGK